MNKNTINTKIRMCQNLLDLIEGDEEMISVKGIYEQMMNTLKLYKNENITFEELRVELDQLTKKLELEMSKLYA